MTTTTHRQPDQQVRRRLPLIVALTLVVVVLGAGTALLVTRSSPLPAEPTIAWSGGGLTEGAVVYRRPDGTVAAVAVAYAQDSVATVHCELVVNGEVVRDTSTFGAALCVWVDGVAWDGAPNEPVASLT